MSNALLYINSKGFEIKRHSYSGGSSFSFCARKYYLERVQGWSERQQRAASFFGTTLEKAWTFWHQHREDTPAAVSEFVRLWAEHKDKEYTYAKPEKDWDALNLTGQELIRLYAVRYPTFPYVVNNPLDFQVQTNFEMFPDTSLAGIEFTSYIDLIAQLKTTNRSVIIDAKTSGKDVPDLVMLDPQLRCYSWVKNIPHVAFLWFRKMGRSISKGDTVTILEPCAGYAAGTDLTVMLVDDFGLWVTHDEKIIDDMDAKFVGQSKAVKEARQAFIEANGNHVQEKVITKQRVQFRMTEISKDSADEIGQMIRQDAVNIVTANERGFWPRQGGLRFPNEKCNMCAMRGICADRPDLRDSLLVRKQADEFDLAFSNESE